MHFTSPPSGSWAGFYAHDGDPRRHRMSLDLTFVGKVVGGTGTDDVGSFSIEGSFMRGKQELHWTKTYGDALEVRHHGHITGNAITGTWEIDFFTAGSFAIWPGAFKHEPMAETAHSASTEPASKVDPVILVTE